MQEQLYKNIFSKEAEDSANESLLTVITEQYPYFGAAQFYLLKNTGQDKPNFGHTAARTTLFFNDPFLLNLQLNKTAALQAFAPELREEIIAAPVHEKQTFDTPFIATEGISVEETVHSNIITKTFKTETSTEKIHAGASGGEEETNNSTEEAIPVIEALPEKEPKPEELKQMQPQREEILFEPLHATDYFASQGIKLSENVLPNDKLGMQLQSFTSWLKTMKKVHPEKMSPSTPANDVAIRHLAEKSNVEEDIITEAMGEAYLQQEKYEKAREIWQKLSLQNPAKSAYFAAKIESLKQ